MLKNNKKFRVIEEGVLSKGELECVIGKYSPKPCTTGDYFESACVNKYINCSKYELWDSCGEAAYRSSCSGYSVGIPCPKYNISSVSHVM